MLELKNIKKDYQTGEVVISALKGLSLQFRENEFVSILGPSGCGKTTLLNIVGGLDKYTTGDLVINGRSTKDFKDSDWDTYRNHTIGFIFQSYNLISHQTVLANVELALTLSGVSKAERQQRAKEALEKVGLADQLRKKPNQMSGGQMQRVAIARALVNNPDILLADEPTGALDSSTSVQIMELLKEIAKDRLVIMVTHNPELANQYSNRIIRLRDGQVLDDSNPYLMEAGVKEEGSRQNKKGTSMSFKTAFSLSLNNLMTKKGRTFMVAFAGSIGIIGIALVLSLSSGVQDYIRRVEEDTLSGYPISIETDAMDMMSMMTALVSISSNETNDDFDRVYSNDIMNETLTAMMSGLNRNDLAAFKKYIESDAGNLDSFVSDIQYSYATTMNIYQSDTSQGVKQINPSDVLASIGFEEKGLFGSNGFSTMMSMDVWIEMLGNKELLAAQYQVLAGRMPESFNEVVIITNQNNELSDYALYSLGLKDSKELAIIMEALMKGEEAPISSEQTDYSYEELLELNFKLILNTDYYQKTADGLWIDKSKDEAYLKRLIEAGEEVKVVGIIRPSEESSVETNMGGVGYQAELMTHLISAINDSEIVKAQQQNPTINVFTGLPFETENQSSDDLMADLTEEESSYERVMAMLGVSNLEEPSVINIYPKDFESKESIKRIIMDYNNTVNENGEEELAIRYTDLVGVMMSSITTIIDTVSYVLVGFVAISLVVSSIMIGIITYISVLERTKEIGILRSIGASKRDISMVFNAETMIIGLSAGFLGIAVTAILAFLISSMVKSTLGISQIAYLPWKAAVVLVLISVGLTLLAGLIPSKVAANKDPVTALRSE